MLELAASNAQSSPELGASNVPSSPDLGASAFRLQVPVKRDEWPARPAHFRHILGLGRGGMAEVELALRLGSADLRKLVVLKRIRTDLRSDPELASMFLEEARLALRMHHPNVVHAYDAGMDALGMYLVMEYLEGQSFAKLRPHLAQSPHHIGDSLVILSEVLSALEYAHTLKDIDGHPLHVVHHDVSPANIFVTYDGQVKLLDFGVASAADRDQVAPHGIITGKVRYMSPEQARGEPSDQRADIYSVGVLLWEALSGTSMWDDASNSDVFERLVTGNIPVLSKSQISGLPDRAIDVCCYALLTDPKQRCTSAAELRAAIDGLIREIAPDASRRALGQRVYGMFQTEAREVRGHIETEIRSNSPRARTLCGLGPKAVREPGEERLTPTRNIQPLSLENPILEGNTLKTTAPEAVTQTFTLSTGDIIEARPIQDQQFAFPEFESEVSDSRRQNARNIAIVALSACVILALMVLATKLLTVRAPFEASNATAIEAPRASEQRDTPETPSSEIPEPAQQPAEQLSEQPSEPGAASAPRVTTSTSSKRVRAAASARSPLTLPARQTTSVAPSKPSKSADLDIDRNSPWHKQ